MLVSPQVAVGLPDVEADLDGVLPQITGALGAVLADRLAAASRMPVHVVERPRDAVVHGLSACLG